jgi:hypothetical protein
VGVDAIIRLDHIVLLGSVKAMLGSKQGRKLAWIRPIDAFPGVVEQRIDRGGIAQKTDALIFQVG